MTGVKQLLECFAGIAYNGNLGLISGVNRLLECIREVKEPQ